MWGENKVKVSISTVNGELLSVKDFRKHMKAGHELPFGPAGPTEVSLSTVWVPICEAAAMKDLDVQVDITCLLTLLSAIFKGISTSTFPVPISNSEGFSSGRSPVKTSSLPSVHSLPQVYPRETQFFQDATTPFQPHTLPSYLPSFGLS